GLHHGPRPLCSSPMPSVGPPLGSPTPFAPPPVHFLACPALGAFPSPLWGGVRGGGRCVRQRRCITASSPSPTLPHKGEGSRPSSPLEVECAQRQRPGHFAAEIF